MINKIKDKPEINQIIGMEEAEAKKYLEDRGYNMRVTNRDGKSPMVKADYDPDRVNVFVERKIISNIDKIG